MRSCSRSAAGVWATVRFGLAGLPPRDGDPVWNRPISPQPASASAHSRGTAAQRRRLVLILRRPSVTAVLALSDELIPAKHFQLPRTEQFDSRAVARLDPATDANPLVFEGLKACSGSLDRRHHAP